MTATDGSVVAAGAAAPVGPYPHARRAAGLLFLSGIGPRTPGTGTIPDGFDAQLEAAFSNVAAVLKAAGSGWGDIVSVTVNGQQQDRKAYVLQLTANAQYNPDDSFPQRKAWVDEQEFLVLRSENINTIGKLQNVSELDNLNTFKDRLEPNTIVVKNVLDGSSTTISITDREDIGELSDSLFDPNTLGSFDPRQFNDMLQVKVPDPTCP